MTEQGYPPRQPDHPGRGGRSRAQREPARSGGWQVLDAFDDGPDADSDLPPWAVPGGIEPHRAPRQTPVRARPEQPGEPRAPGAGARPGRDLAGRLARRAGHSRAAEARRRRSKRRLVTWGGTAVVIAALVAGGLWLTRSPAPKSPYVTTLQKGEYRSVPDACAVISAGGLRQLLGGTPRKVQVYDAATQSQCTFTVDAQPVFRVLIISLQAYGASLTASGNGSATANASYIFLQQRQALAKPSKRTAQPPATITPVSGLGNEAFSALQLFRSGTDTDRVTVTVRYRNVLITASMQGQAGGGFGPVTPGQLRAAALAAVRSSFAGLRAEPTVS